MRFFNSASPVPVFALTGTIGARSKNEPRKYSSTSSRHQPEHVRIDQIAFRQRHNATLHAQQPANIKMLSRLRLDRFIRRNHQQHQIDPRRAGQHVAHKALVPRYIYKTESHAIFFEKRKTKINRNPAPLLFREPVRMRASQRLDKRRFTVINVPSRSDNHAFALKWT